ncbi:hypothetical protein BS614_28740 [Paenibacillus xylanexedens]|nr:hypothetical protein BS614_28740 [Paenibacillus xylanexedens]
MDFLSDEAQFKETLNQEELAQIKDLELREIRTKYWFLIHEAFINENNITDEALEVVITNLRRQEKSDINAYISRKNSDPY